MLHSIICYNFDIRDIYSKSEYVHLFALIALCLNLCINIELIALCLNLCMNTENLAFPIN